MSKKQAEVHNEVYQDAKKHPEHEQRDLCSVDHENFVFPADYDKPHPEFAAIRAAHMAEGVEVPHDGKVLKSIPGMGTVYDWRDSPWTPANGGKINPLIFVQHIPVVPQMAGIADFIRLRDVLVAQGLMVQNATDREGNVALFTPMNILCYQARGANQFSCGTEHMHLTVGEVWSRLQLRAAAWLINLAHEKHGIPFQWADLASGSGVVRVQKRGQTSHKLVSDYAGFHDRSDPGVKNLDPGGGYDREYVNRAVTEWRKRIADGTADTKGFEGI